MKKIISIIIAVCLMFALTACGGGGNADDKYVGNWISVAGETMGYVLTGEDISGFALNLESGGKGTIDIEGESEKLKWSNDDTTLTVTVEGEEMVATVGEDTLVFDDMLGLGMKVTFAKEGTEAANPENYIPETDKAMLGTWKSYKVTDVLGDDASAEIDPDALTMTFKGDYTVDIEYNGETITGEVWSMLDTWGSLDDSEYDFSWDIVEDEIHVTYSNDEDYFIFICSK